MDMGAEERLSIERALDGPGLTMVFQPICDLATPDLTPVGIEAFARFDIATTPVLMFEAAASIGLGVQLEVAAVNKALSFLPQLAEHLYLAVNASTTVLLSGQLHQLLAATATKRIVVDLINTGQQYTNTTARYRDLADALRQLRDIGVRIALDDVATHPRLLNALDLLPYDFLKLNRTLTNGIDHNTDKQAIVNALADLAEDARTPIIAECIETHRELTTLRRLRIPYGQGFALAHPRPMRTWNQAPTRRH